MNDADIVRVGMADYKICQPPQAISTLGLGSCVGVVLYDKHSKTCGMAHIMLPDSTKINHNSNRYKFADTCLIDMLNEMLSMGVSKRNIEAKIAGGARMFSFEPENVQLNIGAKNILAVKKFLETQGIPLVAEDCGDTISRTIEFTPEDFKLSVKTANKGIYYI